ncbi:MAG TPA: glycosyltransferase family 4 protein [Sedimentisphaerales bacterium]|nr:glycosyltransferase family 4 protein [Sedimentisphaerales bacterium]HQG48953.1 glycosyltransferase family 4 protein [Sedimentisphaerales bacterium]
MRIIQICPGSGDNFYCENCLRDAALVKAVRNLGHDVLMVPLYLPLQADKVEQVSNAPIFFGGVNVYLQQKLSIFRKTPRWIDRWFDSRRLLEWAGRKAGMTNARDLGETTISMLQGEDGRQVKELDRFVDWLVTEPQKPDVVCLSNVLLAGLARRIKQRLGVPVVCLLQDEDGFLDGLTSPYAERAWAVVHERVRDIDAFLAVSKYYGDTMATRLKVDEKKIHVVRMGVELDVYKPYESGPAVPTIGFLSRMCPERGLDTLVDAFILLKKNAGLRSAKLRVSGGRSVADEPFIRRQQNKLQSAGILGDVEFLHAFERDAKLEFLKTLSVLSVPEPRPVAYGLYVLEALAMGVPVVEPAIGCFPETIAATGGGVLYEPNTAERLAQVMEPLLLDSQAAHRLGAEGRAGVFKAFDIGRTAGEMIGIYEQIVRK